jgi:hypothetical protein
MSSLCKEHAPKLASLITETSFIKHLRNILYNVFQKHFVLCMCKFVTICTLAIINLLYV